nr:MAG TPA: Superfamily II helicase [Caudoviricetes sp.]
MKNAPNLNKLPPDPFTEAIIFAGEKAWTFAEDWQRHNTIGDTIPPVYLGKKQLDELHNLNIVDAERRYVRVYRAGEISEKHLSLIATKLALAGVQEARFYSESQEVLEDWTARLPSLKADAEEGNSVVLSLPVKGKKHQAVTDDDLKPRIESRDDGVYWITPKVDKESGGVTLNESWLCSPLDVMSIGSDGKDRYLILRWQPEGEDMPLIRAIPQADIGEREGWRTLKGGGVNVTTKSNLRATLADWMQRSGSGQLWRVAHATGWQCGAYIMPDGEIIGKPEHPVLFNGRSSAAAGYTMKGDTASWRNSVARLASGNYSMMTAMAAALAAPLIGLTGADGFGIHFYEQSSAGKTTTANVASSLYGNPDMLRLTWYGTALGLANEAAAHNDALMPLDEIGQGADPVEVWKSAYALFNGTGKLQGAKEGGNRELKRWRTVAISTGEVDMETFVAGAGRKAKAGQLVRLLNIPMSRAVRFHDYENGKQHADALKDAYQNNHGVAGREWIRWLAEHRNEAVAAVRSAEERWRNLIPADYGEQVHRVGSRFAILEAALLLGRVITGWDEQSCRDALQHSYNAWIGVFGTGNKEIEQIIEQAVQFLSTFGMRRFAPLPYDEQSLPISELAGYRNKGNHVDDPLLFYVLPGVFKSEVAKGFDSGQFARTLCEAGILKKSPSDKGYQTLTPRLRHLGNIRVRSYLLVQLDEGEEITK